MSTSDILDAMGSVVKGRFLEIRDQLYNPNVKGAGYERIVRSFLSSYLEGRYSFYERCSLLDTKLQIGTAFSYGENEWDVVAVHRNVVPQIVLERMGAPIVPYDAVSFVVAVKQTLTLPNLEKDLERFTRLDQVEYSKLGATVGGDLSVDQPLRILFYYEGAPNQEQLMTLAVRQSSWDLAVSFQGETFLANGNLPLTKRISANPDKPIFQTRKRVLPWLLLYITASLPYPLGRNTGNLVLNLLREDLEKPVRK